MLTFATAALRSFAFKPWRSSRPRRKLNRPSFRGCFQSIAVGRPRVTRDRNAATAEIHDQRRQGCFGRLAEVRQRGTDCIPLAERFTCATEVGHGPKGRLPPLRNDRGPRMGHRWATKQNAHCEVGVAFEVFTSVKRWLRGLDLNQRPLGYEPNELPDCSTPRLRKLLWHETRTLVTPAS